MRDNSKIDPSDIQISDEIKNLIKKRNGMYKSALVITALTKAGDSWKHAFTRITLSNTEENFSEKKEYDSFILNKVGITIDEFLNILDNLILKGDLNIKNCPNVKVPGAFQQDTYWCYRSSNDEWLKFEWPTNNYIFKIDTNFIGYPQNSRPLASTQYPHFPDGLSAIKYYTDMDIQNYTGNILFLLPNYQLKIDKLIIGSEHLNLKITTNGVLPEELIGKLYCEKEGRIQTSDFALDKNPKSVYIEFIPDRLGLYVLKNDGEILDFRRSYLKWPSPSKDVVIELKESDVIELIKQGENQRVEFKRELNKEKERFAMTAVAFANSEGGAILFGVDDNANIVGVKEEKIEETITNILESHCDPPIEPEINRVMINGNSIVIVRINKGNKKPYILKQKGVYVRRGKTNRTPSKIELDEFYEVKRNPYL